MYSDRVDQAMKKILSSRSWTAPQHKWLERIGQQLKTEVIVDREAFDRGAFKAQGRGFERLNRTFDGRLQEILVEINDALWQVEEEQIQLKTCSRGISPLVSLSENICHF